MSNLATKTLSDIRTICYGVLKQPEDCAAYPYSLLDTFINKAQNDFCYGNLTNLLTKEKLQKQNLEFLNKRSFFTSVQRNTISADAVTGATTLTMSDSSTFAASWAVWINGNVITYTANTGTQLTGCSGIAFDFPSGTKVFQLYSLPTDFGQMTEAYYTSGPTAQEIRLIGFDLRDYREPSLNQFIYRFYTDDFNFYQSELYYTIVDGTYFLPFMPQSDNAIRFEYQKNPTALSAASDVCIIPNSYVLNIVPYFATSEMLFNRWEPDLAVPLNNYGFENARNAYRYYQTQTKENIYNQKVRTASDGRINI